MFNKVDELTRRNFLCDMAKKALGVTVGTTVFHSFGDRIANAAFPPNRQSAARSCIFLNMTGGMSHLDTFDPKEDAGAEIMGPVKPQSTNADGVRISQYLPNLAKYCGKHMAIINSMHTNQGAHEQGQYLLHTSYRPIGTTVHPPFAAWVNRLAGRSNEHIPGAVAIGGGAGLGNGFMSSKFAPVPLGNPSDGLENSYLSRDNTEYHKRFMLVDSLNRKFQNEFPNADVKGVENLYQDAVKLMKSRHLAAFDIASEPQEMHDFYGRDRFGQGCLLARRLVEHQVRFVEVTLGGWDTHYDNFTAVEARAAVLDRAMSALILDLERRGLLAETVVALNTEFGRTPKIVAEHQDGRDHFPKAYSAVLAGGGIKGGQKYGYTDKRGMDIDKNPVMPDNFNATVAHAMGLPVEYEVKSPSGRPFWIANKAAPILELF